MKKKILLFFVFVFVICSAWCISVSALLPQLSADDSVSLIEPTSVTQTNTYYIAFMTDGQMITYDSFSLAKSTYSTTGSNVNREWDFEPVGDGSFYICSKGNSMMYLTANPSSSTVYLDALTTGNSNQKWLMVTGGGQNSLATASTDSRISGKKLYYNNGFQLSSTTFSVVGFFDKSLYIPCTAIDAESFLIKTGEHESLNSHLTYTPTNANVVNGAWLDYSSSDPTICTVSTSGVVYGVSLGTATVTVTHRVSRATVSFTVYVEAYPASIHIYFDEAFKHLCNSDFIELYERQVDIYFNKVKQVYLDFNIDLRLSATGSTRSYPETLTSGITLCPNALNPDVECTCGTPCLNSKRVNGVDIWNTYHHKNAYNMLYRVPVPMDGEQISLLLSGHNVCHEHATNHAYGPIGIARLVTNSLIILVNSNSGMPRSVREVQAVVAHEIGHVFGALDHYGGDQLTTSALNDLLETDQYHSDCIYGENKDQISDIIFCDGCAQKIASNCDIFSYD